MVFSIVILLLILGIAFMHYVQGFFSATLSAIFAVIAAVVAMGFYESVINLMKPGKFADASSAMMLCILFAVTYILLRGIFDKLVPGNVRIQSTIDKVGAAIMGLIAGTFAAGILAIAAQTMSFGPSIGGYARYKLNEEREVAFSPAPNMTGLDRSVIDEMKSDGFKDEDADTLVLIHADDIVVNTVSALSDGSLSGARAFAMIHPNFLQEAFGGRVGIEAGARRTALNFGSITQVQVEVPIYLRTVLPAGPDAELPDIRSAKGPSGKKAKEQEATVEDNKPRADLKATGKQVYVIVRALFDKDAGDEKDKIFRFSPASTRLVTHVNGKGKDYYPIGTMDMATSGTFQYWHNRIDDPLFVNLTDGNGSADLVFLIDDKDELTVPAGTDAPKKGKPAAVAAEEIQPLTFLEVKRLGRVDLSGQPASWGTMPKSTAPAEVMRKMRLKKPPEPAT